MFAPPEIDGSSLGYNRCYRNVGLYSFVNFGLIYQCKVSSISKFDYVGIWVDCRGGSSMRPQVIIPHYTHSYEIYFQIVDLKIVLVKFVPTFNFVSK